MSRAKFEQAIERWSTKPPDGAGTRLWAMCFDISELGSTWRETCAYGTAVVTRGLFLDAGISPMPPTKARAPKEGGARGLWARRGSLVKTTVPATKGGRAREAMERVRWVHGILKGRARHRDRMATLARRRP